VHSLTGFVYRTHQDLS